VPYRPGPRLSGEVASKLGHLDVIGSELVNRLVNEFRSGDATSNVPCVLWTNYSSEDVPPLQSVFAVDGSLQVVASNSGVPRELAFVKGALLRLDRARLSRIDKRCPHPMALRDAMTDAALYHATVLPLRNLQISDMSSYDTVRTIIYESLHDKQLHGFLWATLKWLAYEKWTGKPSSSPEYQCPHCDELVPGLPPDADLTACPKCGGTVFLSDVLGFHLEMTEDSAPQSVAFAYMSICETLLLFSGIMYYWEQKKWTLLSDCLFLKDGPLTLRGQYSKLVIPIRRFLKYAQGHGVSIHIAGQEKTGQFCDHLDMLAQNAPAASYFIPSNDYIRRWVQQRPDRGEPYGFRTNYGNKLFVKCDDYHHLVLSVATGEYKDSRSLDDFIGAPRILATLEHLRSYQYENALTPLHLVNGIASLSTYPSAHILKLFAEHALG
jgi:hypothetical protein